VDTCEGAMVDIKPWGLKVDIGYLIIPWLDVIFFAMDIKNDL
jgi:hypothetical protein